MVEMRMWPQNNILLAINVFVVRGLEKRTIIVDLRLDFSFFSSSFGGPRVLFIIF